jgi:hypothetical protein
MLGEGKMILDLLRADGSIVVNKNLVHAIGLNAAVMFSELISKKQYFEDRGMLTDDGYFYNTVDNIRLDTGLGEKPQTAAIKMLESLCLIKTTKRGLPAKRHFKITATDAMLTRILTEGSNVRSSLKNELNAKMEKKKDDYTSNINSSSQKEGTSSSQMAELEEPNGRINNTKEIILKNNTKNKNKGTEKFPSYTFKDYKNQFSVDEGVMECVEYYLSLYEEFRESEHPRLKQEQWDHVIENMFYVTNPDYGIDFDLDESSVMDMMEQHFKTEYKNCDYNILHFMSDGVRVRRMYEVAY